MLVMLECKIVGYGWNKREQVNHLGIHPVGIVLILNKRDVPRVLPSVGIVEREVPFALPSPSCLLLIS